MDSGKYLTVAALTKYLKFKFEEDDHLRNVFLKGEISNFKAHTSGHYYFSIKDETSKINAIMFKTNASKLPFLPVEGMKILVTGRISVYEATGNYQLYVEDMLEDGVGNLYIAFEQLKEKLEKEGLFDPKYKKRIPKIPSRIGIITAPTGAAIKDILSTIKRRYPLAETFLFPSLVQGEAAARDLEKNILLAQTYPLDVLIIGRGGGSIEDLWPFNEEIVARAIFHCPIPIISAVGHEVDYTISDFVADLRAPTPTGAAELSVPNRLDLLHQMDQYQIRLKESIYQKINYQKLYLDSFKNSFALRNPMIMYENKKQKVDLFGEKIHEVMGKMILKNKSFFAHLKASYLLNNPNQLYQPYRVTLNTMIDCLELLNPLNVLKRGYTLSLQDNKIVTSIHDIKMELMTVSFHDGNALVLVKEKEIIK